MLRFLGALVVILIAVVCVGLYLGWFHIGTESTDGKTHIDFSIEKDKIKRDQEKVVDKIRNIGHPNAPEPAPSSSKP
jgi:hypothetical protein